MRYAVAGAPLALAAMVFSFSVADDRFDVANALAFAAGAFAAVVFVITLVYMLVKVDQA